jgi:hypothetical protein
VDNVVDDALDGVELAPEGCLIGLRQLEDWGVEHPISVSAADHELREADEQALRVLGVFGIAVVVLEDLEAAGMRNPEKLEVWVKLCEAIHDGSSAQSPLVPSDQRAACDRGPSCVVLDGLSLVEDYTQPHHAMKDSTLRLEHVFPPSHLLLHRLTLNGRFILGIRSHHFSVRSENDVVLLQDLHRMARIETGTGAISHNLQAAFGVLLNLICPLSEKRWTGNEKSCSGKYALGWLPVDDIRKHL